MSVAGPVRQVKVSLPADAMRYLSLAATSRRVVLGREGRSRATLRAVVSECVRAWAGLDAGAAAAGGRAPGGERVTTTFRLDAETYGLMREACRSRGPLGSAGAVTLSSAVEESVAMAMAGRVPGLPGENKFGRRTLDP